MPAATVETATAQDHDARGRVTDQLVVGPGAVTTQVGSDGENSGGDGTWFQPYVSKDDTTGCSTGLSAYRVHTKEEFRSTVVCDETAYQAIETAAPGRGHPTRTTLRRWERMSSEERSPEPIGPARRRPAGTAEADTGPEPGSYQQLRDLFEDVTGTDKIIEKQESSGTSRRIADDPSGPTIAEYVGSMVRDDGLGETLAEPDTGSAPD